MSVNKVSALKKIEMADWYLGVQKIVLFCFGFFFPVWLKNNPALEAVLSAVHREVMAFG